MGWLLSLELALGLEFQGPFRPQLPEVVYFLIPAPSAPDTDSPSTQASSVLTRRTQSPTG